MKHPLIAGQGNLPKLRLQAADGASAEVYSHGAHITSWCPAAGDERLFLSSKAVFDSKAAIRGGVPIIFPQFADFGALPKHGFARAAEWVLDPVVAQEVTAQEAHFSWQDSAATRAHWPFAFRVEYVVRVGGQRLSMTLRVINTDTRPFDFTAALHTYVRVGDIDTTTLDGLHGLRFRDSAAGGSEHLETNTVTHIRGEVDRIYYAAARPIVIVEPTRRTRIEMQGFNDAVVWNPGATKGAALTDLDSHRHMVCVEAAVIARPVKLAPGESWSGTQVLIAD